MLTNPADLVRMMSKFMMPPGGSFNKADGPKFAFLGQSTPAFLTSEGFADGAVKNEPAYMLKVLYDHASHHWRDVIVHKINVPTAIFSGDLSPNLLSQRWEHEHIPGSTLFVYSKEDGGDHLSMFRNPGKFSYDLQSFLDNGATATMKPQVGGGIHVRELLRTNDSWNGTAYGAYPAGVAEPVVAEITIPAHQELTWHSHPMPSFAYVLSGEITVEDDKGNKKHFAAGAVMPETVQTAHRGVVGDQPATFIVFYAGTRGMPLSKPASRPIR